MVHVVGMGSLVVALSFAFGAAAQDHVAVFKLETLASRPYRVTEYHPLTRSSTEVAQGQVGMKGELELQWPADGQLHLLSLECGGAVWSLPVCGRYPGGAELAVPGPGGAPFTARPGGVVSNRGEKRVWTPVLIAEAERLKARQEAVLAADVQRRLLWGGSSEDARKRAGESLGGPIRDGQDEGGDPDSLWAAHARAFKVEWDVWMERCPDGAVRNYAEVMMHQVMVECSDDSLQAMRDRWRTMAMPEAGDVAGWSFFREGLDRFAAWDDLSDEVGNAIRRALSSGDWPALVSATGEGWGWDDEERTMAWFLARLGDGGLGVERPTRFRPVRALSEGFSALLTACAGHARYGVEAARLQREFGPPSALRGDLRVFDAGGDLVRLEEVAGSGSVLWLFVDAGAPTTVLPMQVLERTLVEAGPRGTRGRGLPRDLQWVVVDVGGDWEAYQQLVRSVAARQGGMTRWPYRLIHTGADVRWTEQFELEALPSTRHSAQGLQPTPVEPPLPGPDLIGWLARRP